MYWIIVSKRYIMHMVRVSCLLRSVTKGWVRLKKKTFLALRNYSVVNLIGGIERRNWPDTTLRRYTENSQAI